MEPDLIYRAALRRAVERLDFPSAHAFGTEGLNALAKVLALIDAAPAAEPVPLTLDRTLLAKALDNVKRHGGNYVDADHLRWYADAIAKSYEALAALARPEPSAQEDREGDAALAIAPDFTDYDDD